MINKIKTNYLTDTTSSAASKNATREMFLCSFSFKTWISLFSHKPVKCSNGSNQNKRINHVHQIFCPHVSKQTLPQKTGEYQQNKKQSQMHLFSVQTDCLRFMFLLNISSSWRVFEWELNYQLTKVYERIFCVKIIENSETKAWCSWLKQQHEYNNK